MTETEQHLKKFLEQIAMEQNFVEYDIKIEPISSGGANYTTALYNVTIVESDKMLYLFVKVAIMGEKLRSRTPKLYEIEGLAYTKILKAFDRLQDEHKVPNEHRLVFSKFFGYNPTVYEETLVLEDLVNNGYHAYDRLQSIDWAYAKSALKELAKMHALSFAFGEYYSEEFNEILEEVKTKWNAEHDQVKCFFDNVKLNAIEKTDEKNREKLRQFFDGVQEDVFANFYNKWGQRAVLGHGDFRPSNLLHRIRDDGTIDIKIVDLQTVQGNCPIIDLLYFIFTGSDEEFRTNYYQKSLDHYYAELRATMSRVHLDPDKIYSREDFEQELKEKLPYGLTIAALTLPVVTIDAANAPKVNEDMDLSAFSVQDTSDLFAERMNGIVNDYVRWGILK